MKAESIYTQHPPREGLTVSTAERFYAETAVTHFSLGKGTDISPERYERPVLYFGQGGEGSFLIGDDHTEVKVCMGDLLVTEPGNLCGSKTDNGFVYTEVMPGKEIMMNTLFKSGEVFKLKDLLGYEKGSIVNMDIASNDGMKFVVMAFDEGTGLSPHRAPGDALVFALEGKAVIGCQLPTP